MLYNYQASVDGIFLDIDGVKIATPFTYVLPAISDGTFCKINV
jgi:hypothetical protein